MTACGKFIGKFKVIEKCGGRKKMKPNRDREMWTTVPERIPWREGAGGMEERERATRTHPSKRLPSFDSLGDATLALMRNKHKR